MMMQRDFAAVIFEIELTWNDLLMWSASLNVPEWTSTVWVCSLILIFKLEAAVLSYLLVKKPAFNQDNLFLPGLFSYFSSY